MEWMILPLKRYFDFKGRSRRKEYWMYTLFVIIVSIVLSILDAMLGLGGSATGDTDASATAVGASGAVSGGLLANLFALATFIPGLAVMVRRLHDLDRTGWWVLALMGPLFLGIILVIVGAAGAMSGGSSAGFGGAALGGMILLGIGGILGIVLLVWACTEGTRGPNRFGEDPKGVSTNAEEVFG
ncbi:DUF805 domain-containing protein [Sphingomonas sp. MG17]|jgi:uncharacterized membrane protein YhaH (DUF805 family)|uniref:DUF805 domain-containing protein n=1 Tax=Sphingomonas tagetis TaxID=2949092 RepID=A0A9X2HKT4_9SPHN|nr:DUF805 domain-containing protein [Sphingomonas tagetis]MCP3731942.1 DUF805 domain-containing protein [Sphingomonas tagetis]